MLQPLSHVAVIMRTKNVGDVVDQALAALHAQTFRDVELHVVDSGSTDGTLGIVRRWPCQLTCIEPKQYFPGSVLNEAIARTDAEWIVFQNSDVVPLGPFALEELLRPLRDPKVAATFARQVPRPEADGWVRRDYAAAFPERGEAPPWMVYSLPFAAMKREVWERFRFYEDAWASEDTEWGHRVRNAGFKIRYAPRAAVMHSHNYTLRQAYGRRFVEGEADAFIARGASFAIGDAVRRWAGSVANDARAALREGDLRSALESPVRRAVYHWAYLEGRRHGAGRLAAGDADRSAGQAVVLARHG